MPRTVCIDSMICVWGIKNLATPGQEHMIETAKELFRNLKDEQAILLLPSPIVTEILSPVPVPDRPKVVELINKTFRVVPLDTVASVKSAELWNTHAKDWKELYDKNGDAGIRNRFKFDLLIAGIAITRNVEYLFTHDKALQTMCRGHIEVGEIPKLKVPKPGIEQTSLFPKK